MFSPPALLVRCVFASSIVGVGRARCRPLDLKTFPDGERVYAKVTGFDFHPVTDHLLALAFTREAEPDMYRRTVFEPWDWEGMLRNVHIGDVVGFSDLARARTDTS